MIVVDTSAIMALLLEEETSPSIKVCLTENELCMSAGTYSELLVVASAQGLLDEVKELVPAIGVEIVTLDGASARAVQKAFANWGKGRHPASLNFGDCFAYALAKEKDMPLLFVGNDFSKTDVDIALKLETTADNE